MVDLFLSPVFHTKLLHICRHGQTPLCSRFAISSRETIEDIVIDFHNLHPRAHTSPPALGIFSTGDRDLLEVPPHILLYNLAFKTKHGQ